MLALVDSTLHAAPTVFIVRPTRLVLALCLVVGTVGCALGRMLPEGPAVSGEQRRTIWTGETPNRAEYRSPPRVERPVLPFLVFGVPYDLDIVLVSQHPDWDMHEYARVRTPEGPVWLAKDTREEDGDQLLVSGSRLLHESLPEIPLESRLSPVRVADSSEGNRLDLAVDYENYAGQEVSVEYAGPKPKPVERRNGSTMNHSRHQALVVLDLSHRSFGHRASIRIGGEGYRLTRAVGVQPLQLAIRQVQGGIPDTRLLQRGGEGAIATRFGPSDAEGPTRTWQVERQGEAVVVRQTNALRTLTYRFLAPGDDRLELVAAEVGFWNRESPIFRIEFQPALPDVRRRFEGSRRSRWVMDVGDEVGHGQGIVEVRSTDEGAELAFEGKSPWWVADRCATSRLDFGGGEDEDGVALETDVRPCRNMQ